MTTDKPTGPPANIAEFNAVAGRIFTQLYVAFPSAVPKLDRDAIATAMGVSSSDWGSHVMPSGKSFSDLLGSTIVTTFHTPDAQ